MHERMAQIAAAVPEDCQPAVAGFLSVMAEQLDRAGTIAPLTRRRSADRYTPARVQAAASAARAMLRCMPPKTMPWKGYTAHQ
jgi:hypothetical protein